MSELGDVHTLAQQRLRGADLVYTSGRRDLVELLADLDGPATIPELLERRPRLTQSSMYRNMVDLEAVGVVQKVVGADDRARFELAEVFIGHHHHSICSTCGAVDDFIVPPRAEKALETALTQALAVSGFRPTGHRLDVIGTCSACA